MRQAYDRSMRRFEFEIDVDGGIEAPTEIYIPVRFFGERPVILCDGARMTWDPKAQTLTLFRRQSGTLIGKIAAAGDADAVQEQAKSKASGFVAVSGGKAR